MKMVYWTMNDAGLGFILNLLFLALLIAIIIWLIRKNNFQTRTSLDILKRRYANGDITKREYEQIKRDLKRD